MCLRRFVPRAESREDVCRVLYTEGLSNLPPANFRPTIFFCAGIFSPSSPRWTSLDLLGPQLQSSLDILGRLRTTIAVLVGCPRTASDALVGTIEVLVGRPRATIAAMPSIEHLDGIAGNRSA